MESFSMNTSGDYKHQIGNLNRNFVANRTLYSYPSDDLLLATVLSGSYFTGAGLLSAPPASLNHSFPPAVLGFRPPQNLQRHRQQPPLLPLPVSVPKTHQNMNIYRINSSSNNNIRLSTPRVNKNVKNRVRDHSLTPKKSKNQKKNSKREDVDLAINTTESSVSSVVFTPSPPPSSLPLPTFSLRPKLGCKAQAAAVGFGVDAGATDSLRRLLRL
ncbi:hypothetical protein HanXRQr2_Chr13g0565741 [Helianthus annuus]|uniref:Uncharacterized protein n=1 Tax=Helianthus annuus TaxID=4232 RepID=A0A9K3H8E9_HELAN|nr:hypothetical protein HanXRQr2_Chr13g0565741 [Helianthus annuus]